MFDKNLSRLSVTESQNSWGWKGPLEITQAGLPKAGCPGPCSDVF